MMSINTVAARLGLSVHQLRRWELMFGLEIKRGRGQQRQYRPEDLTILERIKELVEQGWPTSQIRPQIEAEGLITPKLIGMPTPPGNPEVVLESLIGMRTFCERRFIEISRQIDELRQLVISLSLKQELSGEADSPWQPMEAPEPVREEPRPMPAPQEITLGPEVKAAAPPPPPPQFNQAPPSPGVTTAAAHAAAYAAQEAVSLGEVTDQNYLTVLGRALDLIGWTDEEADEYSEKTFGVPHWDELGRSQAERLVAHLVTLINAERQTTGAQATPPPMPTPAEEMSFHVGGESDASDKFAGKKADDYDEFYDEDDFDTTPGGGAGTAQTGSPSESSDESRPNPPAPPFEPPA